MDYEKIYGCLIQKRRDNQLNKKEQYCECHHIVPKSCGGTNELDNLINLTSREHLFAHKLLVKIYKSKYGGDSRQYICMTYALFRMTNNSQTRDYKFKSSRQYERLRLIFIKQQQTRGLGENNPMYGTHLSDIRKSQLSNLFSGMGNPMYGKDWRIGKTEDELKLHADRLRQAYNKKTQQEKEEINNKVKNTRNSWSEERKNEVRQKQSQSHLNMSPEAREKRNKKYMETWLKKTQEERELIISRRSCKGESNGTYGSKFMRKGTDKPIRVLPHNFELYLSMGYCFTDKKFIYKSTLQDT